jgi:hypothetical protein
MTTATMNLNQRAIVGLAFIELNIHKFNIAAMNRKLVRLERSKERALAVRAKAELRAAELEEALFI